jgi:hypothetical protein
MKTRWSVRLTPAQKNRQLLLGIDSETVETLQSLRSRTTILGMPRSLAALPKPRNPNGWASRALYAAIGASLLLAACSQSRPRPSTEVEAMQPSIPLPAAAREVDVDQAECEAKIAEVLKVPAVPGAPAFERQRLQILTKAKAEPLLLIDTPQFKDEVDPGNGVRSFRNLILNTEFPFDVVKTRLDRYRHLPDEGRATLLRDGYLYSDKPDLAYALVNQVGAEHLFREREIWLQRGEFVYHAVRKRERYYFIDGPSEGEEVRLLLLDRVGTGPDPDPKTTLARDFRSLKYRLHFSQAAPEHVTEDHIVATLGYGDLRVRSLLSAEGARLSLDCEAVPSGMKPDIERERAEMARRQRAIQPLRHAMQVQIAEQIPFDEPLREYGHQKDGELRRGWLHAYTQGNDSYAFNGDRYKVFDSKGRPIPPQVCVDFLTDTLERSSGTWWNPKGSARGRTVGKLDFKLDILERAKLRRVPGFLEYARSNPAQLEVLDLVPEARVEMGKREDFLAHLQRDWRDYQPGDMLVIRGKTPWDPSEEHYHSFFIYESDPFTGTPLALVGNAGRPSVRSWEVEARRTPERSIRHRIRPKTEWLEQFVLVDEGASHLPPEISPRGNAGI